jgi:hypothetical protein
LQRGAIILIQARAIILIQARAIILIQARAIILIQAREIILIQAREIILIQARSNSVKHLDTGRWLSKYLIQESSHTATVMIYLTAEITPLIGCVKYLQILTYSANKEKE